MVGRTAVGMKLETADIAALAVQLSKPVTEQFCTEVEKAICSMVSITQMGFDLERTVGLVLNDIILTFAQGPGEALRLI